MQDSIKKKYIQSPETLDTLPVEDRLNTLMDAIFEYPFFALQHTQSYIEFIPENDRTSLIIQLMRKEASAALYHAKEFIEILPKELQAEMLLEILENTSSGGSSVTAMRFLNHYIEYLPERLRSPAIIELMKKTPEASFQFSKICLEHVPKENYLDLFIDLSRRNPVAAIKNLNSYVTYIPSEKRNEYLEYITSQVFSDLNSHEIQYGLRKIPQYLSTEASVKLRQLNTKSRQYLTMGSQLNKDHDLDDRERFKIIDNLSAKELAELMVFARDEIWTSSYLGVFNRFLEKFEEEDNQNLLDLFDESFKAVSITLFLEQAVRYNTLEKTIHLISQHSYEDIFESFKQRIVDEKFSSGASPSNRD